MSIPSLELQIQTLPDNPGVYQYYDKEGKILYVGKAKNLKKRVSSYFNKVHDTAKTNVLVKKIVTIKHIVVPTETDALLLENNLIKTLQPRYNILLRDDKTYPWICIKKEPFSRLFPTRKMIKDGPCLVEAHLAHRAGVAAGADHAAGVTAGICRRGSGPGRA
uniref:GIY-YIG nuclease family protein n=1 Tax=Flavobacterium sp. TaxID=239 RepID=UPI00374D049E